MRYASQLGYDCCQSILHPSIRLSVHLSIHKRLGLQDRQEVSQSVRPSISQSTLQPGCTPIHLSVLQSVISMSVSQPPSLPARWSFRFAPDSLTVSQINKLSINQSINPLINLPFQSVTKSFNHCNQPVDLRFPSFAVIRYRYL